MPITEIVKFSISRLSVLDTEGKVDEALDPKLSDEEALSLYEAMILSREADQRMLNMQRQGRIGTFPPSIGQEASICAPAFAMKKTDWLVGSYRELGARLLRGEPISRELLLWGGYEEGNIFDTGDRTLPDAIVLGSQLAHAVGLAYATRYKGEKENVVVAFFGDGATSEGDFHEALNFASAWGVGVVFICQNNQYAISTPRKKQTHSETIAQKAIAYGMFGIQVDGNDALAMYKATREALDRARNGEPSLIESDTYRMSMHTTADDPTRYRKEEEVKEWAKFDPISRFKKYLTIRGIWNDEKQAQLETRIKAKIDEAVKEYESSKDFKPDAPFDNVYGTKHDQIEEQRADFLENVRKDAENA